MSNRNTFQHLPCISQSYYEFHDVSGICNSLVISAKYFNFVKKTALV